jgi:hypothetical protein
LHFELFSSLLELLGYTVLLYCRLLYFRLTYWFLDLLRVALVLEKVDLWAAYIAAPNLLFLFWGTPMTEHTAASAAVMVRLDILLKGFSQFSQDIAYLSGTQKAPCFRKSPFLLMIARPCPCTQTCRKEQHLEHSRALLERTNWKNQRTNREKKDADRRTSSFSLLSGVRGPT